MGYTYKSTFFNGQKPDVANGKFDKDAVARVPGPDSSNQFVLLDILCWETLFLIVLYGMAEMGRSQLVWKRWASDAPGGHFHLGLYEQKKSAFALESISLMKL